MGPGRGDSPALPRRASRRDRRRGVRARRHDPRVVEPRRHGPALGRRPRLASASNDGVVQLWDPAGGRERGDPLKFESREIRIAISPDGKLLATLPVGSSTEPLKLWDTATRRELDLLAVEPSGARVLAF